MAYPITSFTPDIVGLKPIPDGWYDSGKVRANVFRPHRPTWGRGRGWMLHVAHGTSGGVSQSLPITVIDEAFAQGLLLSALNSGIPVVTLEVNEGNAAYLVGKGKAFYHPVNDAGGFFIDPGRPNPMKDIWGAFTWLKRYGLAAAGLDWRGGTILSATSEGVFSGSFIGLAASRGGGRYPALETDPCLAEEDSRPCVFVARIGSNSNIRSLLNAETPGQFPDAASGPSFETKAATLANVSTTYKDEISVVPIGATYTAADHEAASRQWCYMTHNVNPGSTSYFKTVSGNYVLNANAVHDVSSARMWRAHAGRSHTRLVVTNNVTFDAALDSAQVADPEPNDGSDSDMLNFCLAHLEDQPS